MRAKQFTRKVYEAFGDGDVANAVVAEVIKLIGEGHTEVSPDVITTKVSAALGRPFMLKDLVAANNSSPELQHYIDSINPSKIKFSTDILTVKNQDPVKTKEKAQSGVASMASRAASRPRLGESIVGETAKELNIGDDVIITGPVEFEGSTGVIDSFGRDNRFVVVNLYNHGRHSFNSSDVSFNEYADSDAEEAEMYDRDPDFRNWADSQEVNEGKEQSLADWEAKHRKMGCKITKDNKTGTYHAWQGTKHMDSYSTANNVEEGWGADAANARHAQQQSDWDKTLEKHKDDPKMTARLKHLRSWKADEAEKAAQAGQYVVRGRGHKFPGEDVSEDSVTPLRDLEDYNAKKKALQDIQVAPDTAKDPELNLAVMRRLAGLEKQRSELK